MKMDPKPLRVLFGGGKSVKKKAVIAVVIVLLIAVFGVTMYVTNQRMQAEYEANVEEFNRGADSLRWRRE